MAARVSENILITDMVRHGRGAGGEYCQIVASVPDEPELVLLGFIKDFLVENLAGGGDRVAGLEGGDVWGGLLAVVL